MRQSLLILAVVAAMAAGCQQRRFVNVGTDNNGRVQGMLLRSVDEYARKEGISREQAIRQLRQQADVPASQGGTCGCLAGPASPPDAGLPVASEVEGADRMYQVQPAAHVDAPAPDNPLPR